MAHPSPRCPSVPICSAHATRHALIGCVLVSCALVLVLANSARAARIHGITLSTHTNGSDWAGPGLEPALDAMVEVGADWIQIHPYAWIGNDGTVRFDAIDPAARPAWLERPLVEARRRDLKVFVKPHLGYWGSRFAWRGDITFDDDEQWERFFRTYRAWITNVAAATPDADGFAVGTELDRTLDHEAEWRSIIAAVRGATPAPLCYAANWTHYREVGFWDALDVIGIQAYFPLTDESPPTEKGLREAWDRILDDVSTYGRARDRHVVFTELGYNRSFDAAARPWDHRTDGPEAEAVQALCLGVALEEIEDAPQVIGSFLWKWFPQPRSAGRNFALAVPSIARVIRECWHVDETRQD